MKHYINWIAKGLLLVIILVLFDWGVGKLSSFVRSIDERVDPDYVTRVTCCKADILIIGSSTARHHYIPQMMEDGLGLSVYNAGLDGAFFVFQNSIIHYLLDSIKPQYILWEVGEDCLSNNMPRAREYQKMDVLYPYYSNEYIHEAIDKYDRWQKYRMKSNMFCDNSNMFHDYLILVKCVLHGKPETIIVEDLERGYNPLPNSGYDYPEIECDSVAEYINPEKCETLIRTIHECKQHGVQIIFTSSPRHYDADLLSLQQVAELKRIAKREGVPYLDYYHYDSISLESAFFKDCDHLNARGAEAYMEVFIPALRQVMEDLDK